MFLFSIDSMDIDGLEDFADEKVIKVIETYNKVLGVLKSECNKMGVSFLAFGYFRKGQNLEDMNGGFYFNMTDLNQFDGYLIEKKVKSLFSLDNQEYDED